MIFSLLFFIALFLIVIIIFIKATYLVQQAEVILIERLGSYHVTLTSGLHFTLPFIDRARQAQWTFVKTDPRGTNYNYRYTKSIARIDLRESVYDFPKQNVITRDNVTMEINALLYYQITDPKAAVYEVSNLPEAIEKLTQTTLRNVIGSMDLDESLSSRDQINEKLRDILDEATDKWGVRVNRVELQEVNPPQDIRVAMEKQMRAERDRRALILEAEGEKQASILQAEGAYQAQVTRAKGEAEARILVAQAESSAIQSIKNALPTTDPANYLIALNYIKMLPELTQGKHDKMILVPYEATALMGSISTLKELFEQKGNKEKNVHPKP